MSCLDLGCGAGDVMLALGRRVGTTGRVVGVDTDAELGERVAHELNKRQVSDFSFVEADVTNPASLPAGPILGLASNFPTTSNAPREAPRMA